MLAWELKWALNGDRLDFQVNIVSGVCFCAGRQTPPRARAPTLGVLYCPQKESRHDGLGTKVNP